MKDVHEAIRYAIDYLFCKFTMDSNAGYRLNRSLQYQLCNAYERIDRNFGEVTKKDMALLIETWCIANERECALILA
jgi:hypothetical protein